MPGPYPWLPFMGLGSKPGRGATRRQRGIPGNPVQGRGPATCTRGLGAASVRTPNVGIAQQAEKVGGTCEMSYLDLLVGAIGCVI